MNAAEIGLVVIIVEARLLVPCFDIAQVNLAWKGVLVYPTFKSRVPHSSAEPGIAMKPPNYLSPKSEPVRYLS